MTLKLIAPISHFSHNLPGRSSSVTRRTLNYVSPGVSVFVRPLFPQVHKSNSAPLNHLYISTHLSLPRLSYGKLPLRLPFKTCFCLPLSSRPSAKHAQMTASYSSQSLSSGFSERSEVICSFISRFIIVSPLIFRKTSISTACSLDDVFFVNDQHSAPSVSLGFSFVLYMLVLTYSGVHFLSIGDTSPQNFLCVSQSSHSTLFPECFVHPQPTKMFEEVNLVQLFVFH